MLALNPSSDSQTLPSTNKKSCKSCLSMSESSSPIPPIDTLKIAAL